MRSLILLGLLGIATTAFGICQEPFIKVGGYCVFVVSDMEMNFQDARDFCQSWNSDLLSTPTCDDFTAMARYMEINDPNTASNGTGYYVGVSRLFSSGWSWLTLEPLPLGPPFWAYDKGNMDGMDCAAIEHERNYQLTCSMCMTARNFICGAPDLPPSPPPPPAVANVIEEEVAPKDPDGCPANGVQVGHHCYSFYTHADTWERAEDHCRNEHQVVNGALYYPDSCDEYTAVARHLAIEEEAGDWWIGAIDVSGNNEWFWTDGGFVPTGQPYWAFDEPSHTDHDHVREHCGAMALEKKYYMRDAHCDERHNYICKFHLEE